MCSIFAVLDINSDLQVLRQVALRQSRMLRHRGPDWSGIHTCEGAVLAHERPGHRGYQYGCTTTDFT